MKPSEFSAQVHTYVDPDILRRAKVLAIGEGMFLKVWVSRAITEKVERDEKKLKAAR